MKNYESQSHWGMFPVSKYPEHLKHEPETIARNLKCYEPIQFTRVTPIYDVTTTISANSTAKPM
jgi:hypothetical protein